MSARVLLGRVEWELRLICPVCGRKTVQDYMVTDTVWAQCGLRHEDNLHLSCLEERLGRRLTLEDFVEVPANEAIRWAWARGKEGPELDELAARLEFGAGRGGRP